MRARTAYTPQQKREAIRLADDIGPNDAADRLGYGRSTVRSWVAAHKRGGLLLPEPAWPALPYDVARRVPGLPALHARWAARQPYEPPDPITGRQLIARIWPDRTAAA